MCLISSCTSVSSHPLMTFPAPAPPPPPPFSPYTPNSLPCSPPPLPGHGWQGRLPDSSPKESQGFGYSGRPALALLGGGGEVTSGATRCLVNGHHGLTFFTVVLSFRSFLDVLCIIRLRNVSFPLSLLPYFFFFFQVQPLFFTHCIALPYFIHLRSNYSSYKSLLQSRFH